MSVDGEGSVRVLLADQELVLDGVEALVALAREGRIDAGTRVSMPGARTWQPAASLPEVAPHLQADPWAAWDEMDPSAADAAFEAYAEPTDEALRRRSSGTVDGAGPEAPEPGDADALPPPLEDLPLEAVRPMASTTGGRMVVETPRRKPAVTRTGQVIAFPGGSLGGAAAVASLPTAAVSAMQPAPAPLPPMALAEHLPMPAPAPAPAAKGTGTRWWRIALIAGSAVTVMLVAQWYITSTATAVFPPPGSRVVVSEPAERVPLEPAPIRAPVEAPGRADAPPMDSASAELEVELRARMADTPRDVTAPGQLEDALLIELTRMQIQTMSIEAPVLTWAGRKNDVPQSAEIHIRYRGSVGNLQRELAAIGLVVGRYIHTYALDVPMMDVTIHREGAEPRRLPIDPTLAQRFYLSRIDLQGFLAAFAGG